MAVGIAQQEGVRELVEHPESKGALAGAGPHHQSPAQERALAAGREMVPRDLVPKGRGEKFGLREIAQAREVDHGLSNPLKALRGTPSFIDKRPKDNDR